MPTPPAAARARATSKPPGRHRSTDRRLPRTRTARSAPLAIMTVVVVFLGLAPQAQAAPRIQVGVVGDLAGLEGATGEDLALHSYGHFHKKVPAGDMITVRSSASWREVAAARPGSRVYDDIARWADVLRTRGPVMVAYHHEPEAGGSSRYGTAQEFIAAYRKVVSIFESRGADNVEWTWQMTDWAFRTKTSDRRYAAKWYPGDRYVDVVGADVFNWHDCGEGQGRWMEVSALTDPVLAFARAHGKRAALPEFGADPDPRRAQWLSRAHAYFEANRDVMAAVFYFNRGPTNPDNGDCSWTLTKRSEHDAYGAMARDSAFTA